MARYIETTEVAKLIRKVLKKNFAGQKFRVRSNKYSGGSSIYVSYTDGPLQSDVEALVGSFKGATFNGMIDMKEYHDSVLDGEAVSFGNDFLFVDREFSDEVQAATKAKIEELTGEKFDYIKNYAAYVSDEGELRKVSGTMSYGSDLFNKLMRRQDLYRKELVTA